MRLCVCESEERFVLSMNSSQLLGNGWKTEFGPFFKLIFVVFCLILQNFVSQRVRVDIIDEFCDTLDKFVKSEINEGLLVGDPPEILFKVLFWILDLENHDCQELSIQCGLRGFFALFFLHAHCGTFFI